VLHRGWLARTRHSAACHSGVGFQKSALEGGSGGRKWDWQFKPIIDVPLLRYKHRVRLRSATVESEPACYLQAVFTAYNEASGLMHLTTPSKYRSVKHRKSGFVAGQAHDYTATNNYRNNAGEHGSRCKGLRHLGLMSYSSSDAKEHCTAEEVLQNNRT